MIEEIVMDNTQVLTEHDVLEACCGEDSGGIPNGIISVKMSIFNSETMEESVVDEIVLDTPVIAISRSAVFTMADVTFDRPDDYDLVNLIGRLNGFNGKYLNGRDLTKIGAVIVTIVPKEYVGEYFAVGMYGAWCLQPSKAGEAADCVRFIFENEYFTVFEVEEE